MYKYIILLVACLNAFVYAHTYAARDQHFIDDSIQGDLKKVQHYLAAGANHDALNDALLAATEQWFCYGVLWRRCCAQCY